MDRSILELFKSRYEEQWYFSARAEILAAFVRRFAPPRPKAVIADFGAGTGKILAALGEGVTRIALEGEIELAAAGAKSYGLSYVVSSLAEGVSIRSGTLDMALMLDVLEHLDDDQGALLDVFRTLRPGGVLVATVPAFPFMWSRHDELHHHRRRYRKNHFVNALLATGFVCDRVTYFNTLLFPMVIGSRILQHLSKRWASGTDYDRAPAAAALALGWILRQERHLIRRWRLPLGVSLLALAHRPIAL